MHVDRPRLRLAAAQVLGSAALALVLAGCAAGAPPAPPVRRVAMTAEQYASLRQALTLPWHREQLTRDCVARSDAKPLTEREAMAAVLDVDTAELSQVFCERFLDAVARGDLTLEDLNAMRSDDPTGMRRLLRALRQEPGLRV